MIRYWIYEGVEFVHGRYSEAFAAHSHDEYSISVIIAGAMGFSWSRRAHVAARNSIAVINPGELHTGEPLNKTGWETRNILVSPALLEKLWPMRRLVDLTGPVICDAQAAQALVSAHKATEANVFPSLVTDELLTAALHRLFFGHCADRLEKTPQVSTRRAQEYLQANFSKTVRLQTLADMTGITHFHLIRTFARDTGFTPHAYQTQLRMAHALAELKRGRPPAQAAASAGFSDQSHMSRVIKRSQGITPGAIARAW